MTLADAKLHARVDNTAEDTLISSMISAAREESEHILGRALITQTWELVLPAFADSMDLPMAPVSSIASIKYLDSAGLEQTLDSTVYDLIEEGMPPRVVLKSGQYWPATYTAEDAVRIRFVAGYGADGTFVPQAIRAWILVRVSSLYAQREAFATGISVAAMPDRFMAGLLDPYRMPWVG